MAEIKCPKCGSKMRLRKGKRGPFMGCSQYPACDGIRQAIPDYMASTYANEMLTAVAKGLVDGDVYLALATAFAEAQYRGLISSNAELPELIPEELRLRYTSPKVWASDSSSTVTATQPRVSTKAETHLPLASPFNPVELTTPEDTYASLPDDMLDFVDNGPEIPF